jgi:acyl-CoA thioester hydrolase
MPSSISTGSSNTPGRSLAKHYVANPGKTSFDTFITLERADEPGVIHAAGGATIVWVDFPKQKSAPLPDWMRKVVE